MIRRRTIVVGAGGPLGLKLCAHLRAEGAEVTAARRTPRPAADASLTAMGCALVELDLKNVEAVGDALAGHDSAVMLPILASSGPAVRGSGLDAAKRLVFFSSANIEAAPQDPVYAGLLQEEVQLREAYPNAIVLRPTMIYGYRGDGALSRLVALARRTPVMPVPGSGGAMQQPIHIDDLAALVAELALAEIAQCGVYSAAGPEKLSLRALYAAVSQATGGDGRTAPAPLWALRLYARFMQGVGLKPPLDRRQLERIEQDKSPSLPGPSGWRAKVSVEEGLARLVAEMTD